MAEIYFRSKDVINVPSPPPSDHNNYLLVADKDDGDVGAEVFHLWRPLLGDVLQRV